MRIVKKLLLVLAVIALLPVAIGFAVAAAAYSAGTIYVEYDEGTGTRFQAPLPAGLVTTAVRFLPREVCREATEEMQRETGASPWPLLRAAALELEAIPDGVLVAVDSDDEEVRVTKDGRRMVVRVRSGRERIEISAPMRTFTSIARGVEAACS